MLLNVYISKQKYKKKRRIEKQKVKVNKCCYGICLYTYSIIIYRSGEMPRRVGIGGYTEAAKIVTIEVIDKRMQLRDGC